MPEKKSSVEIILMPIAVALVGLFGTYFVTKEQEHSAQIAARAQMESAQKLAAADRQIKVLEIFAEKITSTDQSQRILALKMLRAVEPDLAGKLALAVSDAEPPQSAVKTVAQQVFREAEARLAGIVVVYENCNLTPGTVSLPGTVTASLVIGSDKTGIVSVHYELSRQGNVFFQLSDGSLSKEFSVPSVTVKPFPTPVSQKLRLVAGSGVPLVQLEIKIEVRSENGSVHDSCVLAIS